MSVHPVCLWPDDPLPDLAGWPLLLVRVTTPRDQAALHRELAQQGYVPLLLESDGETDLWQFAHPDGEKP